MVKVIVGLMGGSAAKGASKLSTAEQVRSFLDTLKKRGVRELDTARVYNKGRSEELLGEIPSAQHDFAIATKAPGFSGGSLTYDNVINNCEASLKALKQDKIDLYYFHGPDRQTPLEESCRAINKLYSEGKFDRFGISNYRTDEVSKILDICTKNGWVKPSVYQGGYNPLIRLGERDLFPVLRKHGIAFYAYSPMAGGFFSRPANELRNPPKGGRMDEMKVFANIYVNDLSLDLHDKLAAACGKANIGMKEAALRWLMHHSALGKDDGVILGGSSPEQMEENLKACVQGPLPDELVQVFTEMDRTYREAGKVPPAGV